MADNAHDQASDRREDATELQDSDEIQRTLSDADTASE